MTNRPRRQEGQMRVLAIDPGPTKSGWCLLEDGVPLQWGWDENDDITMDVIDSHIGPLVIEDMAHYGQAVGKDVFETCKWMGRFDPNKTATFISRPEIKTHLCGTPTAKDPNVRQALIDRYGGDSVAIGGKRCADCHGKGWIGRGRPVCVNCGGTGNETAPGVLHGISSHVWSALAVGLTYIDRQNGATK